MKRFLSVLSIFSLFFCSELSANVMFPISFVLGLSFWFSWWDILFSLIIEYLILRYFLPKNIPSTRIVGATVLMNVVSGVAGVFFSLFGDELARLILTPKISFEENVGFYLLLFYIIAVCLNVLIEFLIALHFFSSVNQKRLIKYLFIANVMSAVFSASISRLKYDSVKELKKYYRFVHNLPFKNE